MSSTSHQRRQVAAVQPGFLRAPSSGLTASDLANMLNIIPTALVCMDYSHIRARLASIEAVGGDIVETLKAGPVRRADLQARLKIITFNRSALDLYEAETIQELQENLHLVMQDDLDEGPVDAAIGLWQGQSCVSRTATHYTLHGRPIHVRLKLTVMPGYEHDWSHMLLVIEDITEEEQARKRLAESESYARALFDLAPVSLWALDYSKIKTLLDDTRAAGVTDLHRHINENPEFLDHFRRAIGLLNTNEQSVALFGAPDKQSLVTVLQTDIGRIFTGGKEAFLREALNLWEGQTRYALEHQRRRMDGSRLDTVAEHALLPGRDGGWSLMLVAETDVTARKIAEERLEFLTGHDVLTGLHNRMAYTKERDRLREAGAFPVGVVMADLNGLKAVNDRYGHEAGDGLLRRAGQVLRDAAAGDGMAARIGGDEFVILLPRSTAAAVAALTAEIARLTALDNANEALGVLSFASGTALCESHEAIELAIQQADMRMYRAKRAHYQAKE